jgi:hypothetical protein
VAVISAYEQRSARVAEACARAPTCAHDDFVFIEPLHLLDHESAASRAACVVTNSGELHKATGRESSRQRLRYCDGSDVDDLARTILECENDDVLLRMFSNYVCCGPKRRLVVDGSKANIDLRHPGVAVTHAVLGGEHDVIRDEQAGTLRLARHLNFCDGGFLPRLELQVFRVTRAIRERLARDLDLTLRGLRDARREPRGAR